MPPCHLPSFFKILLDPSAPHLPLPPDFVTKHLLNKIPKHPIIRSANGVYSWRLKITKIGESFCFSDGWSNVVKDIRLTFGDFLIFRLVDQSVFKVLIYSPNGCVKALPSKIKIEQESVIVDADIDTDDDDVGVEVVDDDEEEEDDDDDNDEEEEEDDDDDDDEDEEDEDVEEYEEQIEYLDDDDDDDNEEDDDDVGGDIDGHDGDPFFSSIISRTHKSILRLPSEFVRLAGVDDDGTLKLKNLYGEEWETRLRAEKSKLYQRYYVATRWPDFRKSNDLLEGDECVFKFIRSEGTLLLAKVIRKKRRPRDPPPSDETPAKRKRGRPRTDDGVPANGDLMRKKGSSASEVVKRKKGSPLPSDETPAMRKRGRPRTDDGVPVSEDLKRKKRTPASELVKKKKGTPAPSDETPSKRKRGRPRTDDGVPSSEDLKRKKGSPPPRPRRGGPAAEVLKRKKAPQAVVVKKTRGRQDGRRRRARMAK